MREPRKTSHFRTYVVADFSDPTAATEETPKRTNWLRQTAVVVVVTVVVALLIRTFVVQAFSIPSPSMEPTLHIGDRIVVNKLSYHLHGVDRGNIVVFRRPANENCRARPVVDLVKRVIGLPGETISLSKGPKPYVRINGKRIDETWLPSSEQGKTFPGPLGSAFNLAKPYVIPTNHYFMMGDNRLNSCDSRNWGPIPSSLIVGKVDLRVWPIASTHLF